MALIPSSALEQRDMEPSVVPMAGKILSVILTVAASSMLAIFLSQRIAIIDRWKKLPFCTWLVLLIYADSFIFVLATSIVEHAFGVNSGLSVCSAAILLCLVCYVTTKLLIYLFLIEKVYIIRGRTKRRMQSRLYLFNIFGMMSVFTIVALSNFFFRISRIDNGTCIIGMKRISMIPLISFDVVINVYLTILFLLPLRNLYSFRNLPKTPSNIRLRTCAIRTLIGACCTLISSMVNLTVLMVLKGEPAWICLLCCNADIIFSAVVIQWVTSKDHTGTNPNTSASLTGTYNRRRDPEYPITTTSITARKSPYPDVDGDGVINTNSKPKGGINVDVDIVLSRLDSYDESKSSSSSQGTSTIVTARASPSSPTSKFGHGKDKERNLSGPSTLPSLEHREKSRSGSDADDTTPVLDPNQRRGSAGAGRVIPGIASHNTIRSKSKPFEEIISPQRGVGSGGVWIKAGSGSD